MIQNNHRVQLEVLIPTFNRPKKLYHLLCSGMRLHMPSCRFVVIDDGSWKLEEVPGLGVVSVEGVSRHFNAEQVRYIRMPKNLGLFSALQVYYNQHCQAQYTLLTTDKNEFIDASSIRRACKRLDHNLKLSMVQIPILFEGEEEVQNWCRDNLIITGAEFIHRYIHDIFLQKCALYAVIRVNMIVQLNSNHFIFRRHELPDAFGSDLEFIMAIARAGEVGFESDPHIHVTSVGGLTEQYPLTFAYCYHQYAQRIFRGLFKDSLVSRCDRKKYMQHWNLEMLRGLVCVYRPGSLSVEKNTNEIRRHLKVPVFIYFLWQHVKYLIFPNKESCKLVFAYIFTIYPYVFRCYQLFRIKRVINFLSFKK